ncbi:histidine kinase [Streptomyces sp. NPDC046261]|uniref:sensor histidine kinase n=1 Tax=Streptomyces sp. NPDC046261 TaxID=3157200 RepID=UPI0033EF41BB
MDSYTRWTLYLLPWLLPVGNGLAWLPDPGGVPALVWLLLSLCFLQCAQGMRLIRRSLDHYLRKRSAPWWELAVSGVIFALTLAVFVAMVRTNGSSHLTANTTVLLHAGLVCFGSFCLLTRRIRTYLAGCAGAGAVAAAGVAVTGSGVVGTVTAWLMVFLLGVWSMTTVRTSAWFLAVMWEVEAARGTQARLAVAEERLRFSRDMHDVLGRNLAVIALKSELATQLSRRGAAAALEEMDEVQRIARESQRELREVVRGYREADLHTELAGARGVLAAAGIECRIVDSAGAELPPAVQSALAWVVREATTNVLRHAEATRCAVRLRVVEGVAVLLMENDGVRRASGEGPAAGGGSGLAGLRERLAGLGGTLVSERRSQRTFRLTVKVPLAQAGADGGGDGVGERPSVPVGAVAAAGAEGERA